MKIALVYDWVNKFGGAERVLVALHAIWPEAPLYAAVYNRRHAPWADRFKIYTSFLQKIPHASTNHEFLPFFMPYAFESFNFDNYDVVLTITSGYAKSIITSPRTLHICYCLTPVRYLWSGYHDYLSEPGNGLLNPFIRLMMKTFAPSLRRNDYIYSQRPDRYIAISNQVASRINKYYGKTSVVIYPPVDVDTFKPHDSPERQNFYLIVSRLVPYKRLDYVITAFNRIHRRLIIIGRGIDEKRLKNNAGNNVEFIDHYLTDKKLCWYYQKCKALIFPGEEDFGIVAAEAQACGTPVIGYKYSGVREIVKDGITGILYNSQSGSVLQQAIAKFERQKYQTSLIRENATRFTTELFQKQMKSYIEKAWKVWGNAV